MIYYPGLTLEIAERVIVEEAFRFYRSNKTQTAQALGIAIRTLDAKLEKYESERAQSAIVAAKLKSEREAFLARQRSGFSRAAAGPHLESAIEAPSQSVVPMPERAKIQEVLPKHTSKSGTGKSR